MTMIPIYIYDVSGRDLSAEPPRPRFALLEEIVASKGGTAEPLPGDAAADGEALILAHQTDMRPAIRERLDAAADRGAVVITYSGGTLPPLEKSHGHGLRVNLGASEAIELIRTLPAHFTLADVWAALAARRNRHLVRALMIASWSVALASDRPELQDARIAWTSGPEKWRALFDGVAPADLRAACGIDDAASRSDMAEVDKAIHWFDLGQTLTGRRPPRPAFGEVAAQLGKRFDLGI